MARIDGREFDQIRDLKITRNYTKYAEGSVFIEMGDTKILCNASIEDKVPPFLRNTGTGWINAEYSMLPRSTQQRKIRDASRGKIDGRSQEIQRLIGRAIRSVVDLDKLGERTIWIDCDVIQADGGTRTASITGAFVAVLDAINKLHKEKAIKHMPVRNFVSAISVGIVNGEYLLDLCYEEDSNAQVDMNIIMTDKGEFVELQGTGEECPFSRKDLEKLLELGEKGNKMLLKAQREALGEIADEILGVDYGVIATGNAHKLEEIGDILKDLDYNIYSLKDVDLGGLEIEENGKTFEHNALIKAREVAKRTKMITIADDSGLEVDAIGKKPGIYSARYAGEHGNDSKNNEKLLEELKNVKDDERKANFICVIVAVTDKGEKIVAEGKSYGVILEALSGNEGFGYDPLFFVPEYKKTFAEMTSDEKNAISHRGRALEKLKDNLKGILK